jgi:hypothetical protein
MLDDKENQKPELQSYTPHETMGRGYVLQSWDERKTAVRKGEIGGCDECGPLLAANHRESLHKAWSTALVQTNHVGMVRPARPGQRFAIFFFVDWFNPWFWPCVRNRDFSAFAVSFSFNTGVILQTRLRQKHVVEKNKGWLSGLLGPSAEPTVTRRQRRGRKGTQ